MKANEAPEKLYMPFEDEIDRDCLNTYAQKNTYHKEIEYTRTDAFIKKAAEWMFSQANVYTVTHVSNNGGIHTNFYADKMVEDFRKYMEGE